MDDQTIKSKTNQGVMSVIWGVSKWVFNEQTLQLATMIEDADSLNVQTPEWATMTEDADLLEYHILYICQHNSHTL